MECGGKEVFSAHMHLFALSPRSERLDLKYHSNGREWITEKSFFLSFRSRPQSPSFLGHVVGKRRYVYVW